MASETETDTQIKDSTPPKFSRYRSVRNAAREQSSSPSTLPQTTPLPQNESIARSMSRYRHAKLPGQNTQSPVAPKTPIVSSKSPISPLTANTDIAVPVQPIYTTLTKGSGIENHAHPEVSKSGSNSSGVGSRPRTTPTRQPQDAVHRSPAQYPKERPRAVSHDEARAEARDILKSEEERMKRLKAQQKALRHAERERKIQKAEAEAHLKELEEKQLRDKQLAELEAADLAKKARLAEEERIANKKAAARIAGLEAKRAAKMDRKERFAFLSRDATKQNSSGLGGTSKHDDSLKRIISAPRAIVTAEEIGSPSTRRLPPNGSPREGAPLLTASPNSVKQSIAADVPKLSGTTRTIKPARESPATGTGAPVSAVNVEGRSVLITCNGSSIRLPITTSTTSYDLICSAANCLSEGIDPKKSIIVESFTQLGLERPLRKYEHIRDVMNSWDNDSENTLLIIPSPENVSEDDLDVKSAPQEQPGDISVFLHHSMKPGKWDRRWVTLRSDGQMLVAKKPDGETSNICHLSDFDIYSPTARQLSRHIRPPKRICFAVKSQQKSSMFLSGANFVHFFSTSDKKLAAAWYKGVQAWRSWYLVNVMGESQQRSTTRVPPLPGASVFGSDSSAQPGHKRSVSADSTPYQLGSFTPLFESDGLMEPSTPVMRRSNSVTKSSRSGTMSAREPRYPPTSFPNRLQKDIPSHTRVSSLVQGASPREIEESTFKSDGLLGRTYSQRQKAQRDRDNDDSSTHTFRTGLLSNSQETTSPEDHLRTNSIRSVNESSRSLGRRPSHRQKPKPLIDLTPVYQEPPQHARKGKGVAPEPGKQLIDCATGIEQLPGAIVIPAATTWRKPQPQASGGVADTNGVWRSGSTRVPGSGSSRKLSIDGARPSIDAEGSPFTGAGLLAAHINETRPIGTGRGVATGDRDARAPMLDVTEKSRFQEGSLLRSVEKHLGGGGPVIDREKRVEGNVRVGEGV